MRSGTIERGMPDRAGRRRRAHKALGSAASARGCRIRIATVDSCIWLTAAWARIFEWQPDMRIVASLSSPEELLGVADKCRPDVVLMDLPVTGTDPLNSITEMSRLHPGIRILVCCGHIDPNVVHRVMDAGAWGCVAKAEESRRIIDAVRRIARGEVVIPERPQ